MNATESNARPRALVLLVDDCDDSREMYAEFLGESFEIAQASSGAEAIAKAKEMDPDAIVMDIGLPDMPGQEAISLLRRDVRTERIPVVVVSGFAEPEGVRNWDAYMTKPCRPDVLTDCIGRILGGR